MISDIKNVFHFRKQQRELHETKIKQNRENYDNPNLDLDTKRKNFYNSESKHTPEYRKESQRFREILDQEDEKKKEEEVVLGYEDKIDLKSKKPRKLFDDKTGKALNVNEAKIDFEYDDSDPTYLVVTLEVWKHLDGSFIEDIVVEPTYLRVTIKGKILQLRFLEEVYCSEERYVSQKTTNNNIK